MNIDAPKNFAMTITSVGHQRETRPRLRNHHGNSSDDPKSAAAPRYVTKIDAVLPSQSPTQHLTTVYAMHGWHVVLQHQNCHMTGCYADQ